MPREKISLEEEVGQNKCALSAHKEANFRDGPEKILGLGKQNNQLITSLIKTVYYVDATEF